MRISTERFKAFIRASSTRSKMAALSMVRLRTYRTIKEREDESKPNEL